MQIALVAARGSTIDLSPHTMQSLPHATHPVHATPPPPPPRFVDDEVDMTQSNAILRHIGRKHGLMGSTEKEHSMIDVAMEGVESIRAKYVNLIYVTQVRVRLCVLCVLCVCVCVCVSVLTFHTFPLRR
jgi:hypothetical protein